jgi:hypothetical protein
MGPIALAVLLIGIFSPAGAVEPTRTVDGRSFVLVGSAERKKDDVKFYDMALYVDEVEARRAFPALVMRAGGKDHRRLTGDDHAQSFLVWGRFPKLAILKFARKTTAIELRQELRDGFEDGTKGADALLALLGDMDAGDELVIRTGGEGEIILVDGADKKSAHPNPKLVRALWNVWLGTKSISPDVRRALVDKIDVLGK